MFRDVMVDVTEDVSSPASYWAGLILCVVSDVSGLKPKFTYRSRFCSCSDLPLPLRSLIDQVGGDMNTLNLTDCQTLETGLGYTSPLMWESARHGRMQGASASLVLVLHWLVVSREAARLARLFFFFFSLCLKRNKLTHRISEYSTMCHSFITVTSGECD